MAPGRDTDVEGPVEVKRLSVIIANYNYERYVAVAIESALNLQWDDLEVIVVDDGSTDGSPDIIRRYAGRAKILLADNASQRVAANRGYALATGDVIVFLDSDDFLPPELAQRLAEVWTPSTSKVQFQMQRVDQNGVAIGDPFPEYRTVPSARQIHEWAVNTTAYPTPPGSGNAYARHFLDKIFPVESSVGDFVDSACLAAAPFFGDVITVPGTIVGYRQHGVNDSNLLLDYGRFPREVLRARARWRFAQVASGASVEEIDERRLFRSRELLQLRVASHRLCGGGSTLPDDGRWQMLGDALRSPFCKGPESVERRCAVMVWCLVTLFAPRSIATRLIASRYRRA